MYYYSVPVLLLVVRGSTVLVPGTSLNMRCALGTALHPYLYRINRDGQNTRVQRGFKLVPRNDDGRANDNAMTKMLKETTIVEENILTKKQSIVIGVVVLLEEMYR